MSCPPAVRAAHFAPRRSHVSLSEGAYERREREAKSVRLGYELSLLDLPFSFAYRRAPLDGMRDSDTQPELKIDATCYQTGSSPVGGTLVAPLCSWTLKAPLRLHLILSKAEPEGTGFERDHRSERLQVDPRSAFWSLHRPLEREEGRHHPDRAREIEVEAGPSQNVRVRLWWYLSPRVEVRLGHGETLRLHADVRKDLSFISVMALMVFRPRSSLYLGKREVRH
jgi:hypothetical protein